MPHANAERAVLITNLGSPDSYAVSDVRRYLIEFLMDERVLDVSYLLRLWLVRGVIVPRRAPRSAAAYKSIWWKDGSPLMVITEGLRSALEKKLQLPVFTCMRYGNPTPTAALKAIQKKCPQVKEVILVPLYPHYAMSSFETAVLHVEAAYKKLHPSFTLRTLRPYYKDEKYIASLAESISPYVKDDAYDHILFSYHGVPRRHILKGDITKSHCLQSDDCCTRNTSAHAHCYRHQCMDTTRLLCEKLGIPKDKMSVVFQSRLGKEEWLRPYTADELQALPSRGVKRLLVACPAFVSDCLETLEEIAEEGKETFLHAGGEQFMMIPCMNTRATWVDTLADYVRDSEARVFEKPLHEIVKSW